MGSPVILADETLYEVATPAIIESLLKDYDDSFESFVVKLASIKTEESKFVFLCEPDHRLLMLAKEDIDKLIVVRLASSVSSPIGRGFHDAESIDLVGLEKLALMIRPDLGKMTIFNDRDQTLPSWLDHDDKDLDAMKDTSSWDEEPVIDHADDDL